LRRGSSWRQPRLAHQALIDFFCLPSRRAANRVRQAILEDRRMLTAEMVAPRYWPDCLLETDRRVPPAMPVDKKGLCPLFCFVGPFYETENEMPTLDAAGQRAITRSLYRFDGNVAVALAVSVHGGHLRKVEMPVSHWRSYSSRGLVGGLSPRRSDLRLVRSCL
jgi:hypothetical protein